MNSSWWDTRAITCFNCSIFISKCSIAVICINSPQFPLLTAK
jgi:hypothetical protein